MRGKAQIEATAVEAENAAMAADLREYLGEPTVDALTKWIMPFVDDYTLAVLDEKMLPVRGALGILVCQSAMLISVDIDTAMLAASEAASRNGHKGTWRRMPLGHLFAKLEEEAHEYALEAVSGDSERSRSELGDLVWVAIMIADHGLMLEPEEASWH